MSVATTKLVRTGLFYAALILVGGIFSSIARGFDDRSIDAWISTILVVVAIALASGFAIASLLWLCDDY